MNTLYFGLYLLIGATVLFSWYGFENRQFFNSNTFQISAILKARAYKRLISSGFMHVSWTHLFFNMFALYSFGQLLLQLVGQVQFFVIYFVSLLGGNILSLIVNRHKDYYSAVGASGAVSGVIFACIALYPQIGIYIFFIPIKIPGWIFGPAFLLFSMYGMQRQGDSIGHEAHIGGALIGVLITLVLQPFVLKANPLVIIAILLPTLAFLIYTIRKPPINPWVKQTLKMRSTKDDVYRSERAARQKELDVLLDKANQNGWESLSKDELDRIDALANGK